MEPRKVKVRVFVLTDQGWMKEDDVFTPITKKIKKDAKAMPIKATKEKTVELQKQLPMVIEIKGQYYIKSL